MKTLRTTAAVLLIGLLPLSAQAQAADYWQKQIQDPMFWALVIVGAFLLMALAAVNKALNTIRDITNPKAAEERAAAPARTSSIMQALTDAVPVEREAEVMTDHEYDGIKELDNNLPPWWVWGFAFTVFWGIYYLMDYHVLKTSPLSGEEYAIEMANAKASIDAYLATAADLVDENTVVALTDEAGLAAGNKIFQANCAACHMADGGGSVGPNLTDAYWKHGGSINDVFKVIKNGVVEKGMISWKEQLSPSQMQQVASYILSLQGTTPANPKAPEGDLYTAPAAGEAAPADSTATEAPAEPAAAQEPATTE